MPLSEHLLDMLLVSFWFSSLVERFPKHTHTKSLASFAGHHQGFHCSWYELTSPLTMQVASMPLSRVSHRRRWLSMVHIQRSCRSSGKPWRSCDCQPYCIRLQERMLIEYSAPINTCAKHYEQFLTTFVGCIARPLNHNCWFSLEWVGTEVWADWRIHQECYPLGTFHCCLPWWRQSCGVPEGPAPGSQSAAERKAEDEGMEGGRERGREVGREGGREGGRR